MIPYGYGVGLTDQDVQTANGFDGQYIPWHPLQAFNATLKFHILHHILDISGDVTNAGRTKTTNNNPTHIERIYFKESRIC